MRLNGKSGVRMALAAALAVPCAAFAQAWYVGASAGEATAKDWCNPAPGIVVTQCDNKDTGAKVFVGYWFTPFLAIEVDYLGWGTITATTNGVSRGGSNQSYGFATLVALPIGDFQPFAKLGVVETHTQSTGGGRNVESHFGGGVLWNVGKTWALRAEWERAESNALEMVSIGVQFKF